MHTRAAVWIDILVATRVDDLIWASEPRAEHIRHEVQNIVIFGTLEESGRVSQPETGDEKAQFMRVTGSHVDRAELSSRHFMQRQQVAERTPCLCAPA